MSSREMGVDDSPLLFIFPTKQAKHFRPHSASSTSGPSMAGANPGVSTTVHQNMQRFDEAHSIFATGDMQFDGFLDPSMLSSAFHYPEIAPTSHLSQEQIAIPSNTNMHMFLNCYPQLEPPQYNYPDCPRSVPHINFHNTMDSLEEPRSLPPSAYHLDPQVPHHPMNFPAQPTPYPLQEQEVGNLQNHHPVDSIEMYAQDDPDAPASALTDHKGFYRCPSTPFGGNSEIESPCEDYNLDRDEPYAQRIFRCLKEAPNHTMVLKDIYNWFRENTDKGKDPNVKGWQNSIRHNLSMNKAFVKLELPPEKDQKKRYVWQLSKQALREGVQSTTRFRSKQPNKRGQKKSSHLLASRVASGQKGGEATRKSALLRRSDRILEANKTLERARNGTHISSGPQHRYSSVPSSVPKSLLTNAGECMSTSERGSFNRSPFDMTVSFQPPKREKVERPLRCAGLQYGSPASGANKQSPTFSDGSYANSPEFPGQTEVHFLPLRDGPLFYETPESSSEPHTPSTYGDKNMDQQPFFVGSSDGMMF